jgi:hypothetical protein
LVLRRDKAVGDDVDDDDDDGGLSLRARTLAREGGVTVGTCGNDANVSAGRINAESRGGLVGV